MLQAADWSFVLINVHLKSVGWNGEHTEKVIVRDFSKSSFKNNRVIFNHIIHRGYNNVIKVHACHVIWYILCVD